MIFLYKTPEPIQNNPSFYAFTMQFTNRDPNSGYISLWKQLSTLELTTFFELSEMILMQQGIGNDLGLKVGLHVSRKHVGI